MKLTKNELYALHYADHQTIEQIAEHCPAVSPHQMKKILAMSEQKYQMQKNSRLIQESDVQVTAVHPYGWRRTFAAAACLLICTGTFGGIYSLNRLNTVVSEDMQTAEHDFTEETQDTTENTPEENQEQKEISLFHPKSEQDQSADNQKKSSDHAEIQKNDGTAVPVKDSDSDSKNTSVQSLKEQEVSPKILSNVVPVQVNAETPAEELPAETSTETPIETMTETPVQMGLVWTELSYDNKGYPVIPGFRMVDETEYASSSDENARYLVPDSLDRAENRVLTMELPAYLPNGITVNSDNLKSAESYHVSAMSQNKDIWNSKVEYDVDSSYFTGNESYLFEFRKCIKRVFANIVYYEQGKGIFKPFTYDGKNGYVYYDMETFGDYSETDIVWDRGDYIFQIETYDLNGADDRTVEEIIEMLVSAAPHDTSADPVAENLPEIPGFTVQSGYLNAADQNYWLITADHLINAPAEVYTNYVPAYVPAELYSDFEGWQYIEDWYEAENRCDGLPR
ncbi:MAG: hypothetical protein K2H82_07960, partial [Oscillospiraceae bacterium]|nr:hypothetical protein [Oscillospiraceae bacterium]